MKFRYLAVSFGSGGGYWGRGGTIAEAARQIRKEGARATEKCALFLILGDDNPSVNGAGYICREQGSQNFKLGVVTVGQAMRMESEKL